MRAAPEELDCRLGRAGWEIRVFVRFGAGSRESGVGAVGTRVAPPIETSRSGRSCGSRRSCRSRSPRHIVAPAFRGSRAAAPRRNWIGLARLGARRASRSGRKSTCRGALSRGDAANATATGGATMSASAAPCPRACRSRAAHRGRARPRPAPSPAEGSTRHPPHHPPAVGTQPGDRRLDRRAVSVHARRRRRPAPARVATPADFFDVRAATDTDAADVIACARAAGVEWSDAQIAEEIHKGNFVLATRKDGVEQANPVAARRGRVLRVGRRGGGSDPRGGDASLRQARGRRRARRPRGVRSVHGGLRFLGSSRDKRRGVGSVRKARV